MVLFSSEKILLVQFSVLKKWGENRTELNFGNTSDSHPHNELYGKPDSPIIQSLMVWYSHQNYSSNGLSGMLNGTG